MPVHVFTVGDHHAALLAASEALDEVVAPPGGPATVLDNFPEVPGVVAQELPDRPARLPVARASAVVSVPAVRAGALVRATGAVTKHLDDTTADLTPAVGARSIAGKCLVRR